MRTPARTAALLALALLFATPPALAQEPPMLGESLVEKCRPALLPREQSALNFDAHYCLGYVTAAFSAAEYVYKDEFCLPAAGVKMNAVVELFARYLIDHPDQHQKNGVTIMGYALRQAFPCRK